MIQADFELPANPSEALKLIGERSAGESAVLILKLSPICGVSTMAEREVVDWLENRESEKPVEIALIDVVGERELARGLTALLDIEHQSPQLILFRDGKVEWHGSHYQIKEKHLVSLVDGE